MMLFEAQSVKNMIIRQYFIEIKPNKKIMDLGRLLHKHPILDIWIFV